MTTFETYFNTTVVTIDIIVEVLFEGSVWKCGKQPCDTSGLTKAQTCILLSPS